MQMPTSEVCCHVGHQHSIQATGTGAMLSREDALVSNFTDPPDHSTEAVGFCLIREQSKLQRARWVPSRSLKTALKVERYPVCYCPFSAARCPFTMPTAGLYPRVSRKYRDRRSIPCAGQSYHEKYPARHQK